MMSLAQIIKHLKNTITSYTNFINSKSIENYATTKIVNYINGTEGGAKSIRNVIKERTFKNLPPKIGYFNETTVPLIANFNMSINVGTPWAISDDQGREVLYFDAKGAPNDTPRLYRAYRMSLGQSFIYENTSLSLGYLKGTSAYANSIWGLGSQYIVIGTSEGKYHIVNNQGEPENWTLEADITSIVQNCGIYLLNNIMYFREYGTIYITGGIDNNSTIGGRLYKVSTGALIKTDNQIFDFVGVTRAQNPSIYSMYTHFNNGTTVYNEATKELAISLCSYIQYQDSHGGRNGVYHMYKILADCPKEHFLDGRGELRNKIPDSQYKILTHAEGLCQAGDSGVRHITYDSLENKIRVVYRYQSSDDINLFVRDAAANGRHACEYFQSGNVTSVSSTDASPWAKRLYAPRVINEEVYLQGKSRKYGGRVVHVDFAPDTNGVCNIKAGTWWFAGEEGDVGDLSYVRISCVKTGNSAKYYYAHPDSPLMEITTSSFTSGGYTKNGKKSLVDTGIKVPTVPSGYTIHSLMYNPKWNKWFFVASKTGTNLPGETFLLEYDIASKTWTDHFNERPPTWTKGNSDSLAAWNTSVNSGVCSNAFIDDDGTMYFKVYFSGIGGSCGFSLVKLSKNGSAYTMAHVGNSAMTAQYPSDPLMLGWNNKFHYFCTWTATTGTTECRIYTTKHWGSSADKPNGMDSILVNNDWYTWRFVCASATGMVCYLQDTPVFLGGYFSTVPAKEIPLKSNSANYIYFHRNSDDYKVVDVEVTQSPRNDVDGFNRVYLTKVVTNADGPVSQEYNQIDNYHKKK